jgi:hypothetical protein
VVIFFFSQFFTAGKKEKLIHRLSKALGKLKLTKLEALQGKIDAIFEEKAPNSLESNHQKCSRLYAENFNSIDKFNEYFISQPFHYHNSTP